MTAYVFDRLYHALDSAPYAAFLASFGWGVLSVLLSPCHLAGIPLVIGFIDDKGGGSTKRAFVLALFFSAGVSTTIAAAGLATGLLGRLLGDVGPCGDYAAAVVFLAVGLYLLGVLPLPFAGGAGPPVTERRGRAAAFLLGLVFGVALGPCTFAYMAPVLGVVFSTVATRLFFSVTLVAAYALGHCSVIVLAGTFTGLVQHYLNWNEKSRGTVVVRRICGVLVILGGLYLVYSAQ